VEPIEQDFNYWSKRSDRLPLLPPLKPPRREVVAIRRLGENGAGGRYVLQMKGPAGEVTSNLELTPGAAYTTNWVARADSGMAYCNANYEPFAVVQTFDPPVRLCRVDVRGPNSRPWQALSPGRTTRISSGGCWHPQDREISSVLGRMGLEYPAQIPQVAQRRFIRQVLPRGCQFLQETGCQTGRGWVPLMRVDGWP
jgi:hypothetical protein